MNERGQVVGWSGSPPHAFLWENGKMRDLGVLNGHYGSLAWAINDRRLVVGYSVSSLPTRPQSRDCYRAVVWKYGKVTDLGVLSGAKKCSSLALERGWQSSAQAVKQPGRDREGQRGPRRPLDVEDRRVTVGRLSDRPWAASRRLSRPARGGRAHRVQYSGRLGSAIRSHDGRSISYKRNCNPHRNIHEWNCMSASSIHVREAGPLNTHTVVCHGAPG
ncbi:MAG: hypothetical protein ACXVRK_02215 [Gaiellaceae bacterium]